MYGSVAVFPAPHQLQRPGAKLPHPEALQEGVQSGGGGENVKEGRKEEGAAM